MKGFKASGYGPSAGFKFPSKMGFTGSTGEVTAVTGYTRRRFADGGFVRQDNPRMKAESVGDSGSALVRRARSSTNLDQESGGKSPVRPGFKHGGAKSKRTMKKANGGPVKDAKKDAEIMRNRLESKEAAGMLSDTDRAMLDRMRASERQPTQKKADGGTIERISEKVRRRSGAYKFGEGLAPRDVIGGLKQVSDLVTDKVKNAMWNRQRTVGGRNESVGEYADRASTGKKEKFFARGGKAKRMGYANGGGVTAAEAKEIAERTVGEHVRYQAPKGHAGFERLPMFSRK